MKKVSLVSAILFVGSLAIAQTEPAKQGTAAPAKQMSAAPAKQATAAPAKDAKAAPAEKDTTKHVKKVPMKATGEKAAPAKEAAPVKK